MQRKELPFIREMFDGIAPRYDFLNRLLSLRQDVLWRKRMVSMLELPSNGKVLDVAVDVRRDSPTFGEWTSVTLSRANGKQLYIPEGFAHGFCVLTKTADVMYKCSDYYDPPAECTVRWDDPDLAIDWPLESPPELSAKDRDAPFLKDIASEKLPPYEEAQ